MSYTPGPWCINPNYPSIISTVSNDADIAEVDGWPADLKAEEEANKRLIAAAPDLLSALQECLRIIDEIDEYQKRPERGDYGVECACCMGEMFEQSDVLAIDAARAAISRATEGK